jgi:hypothetical protein
MYYDLLFASVWHTLRLFGYSHDGVESGAVAVLQTWSSTPTAWPLPISATGKGMPANEQKLVETVSLMTILYLSTDKKTQKPAIRQRTLQIFFSKNLKIVTKYIALNPAGVVQHRVIAWSCRPLRLLFIVKRAFFITSPKNPAIS